MLEITPKFGVIFYLKHFLSGIMKKMSKVEIIVATHKAYEYPKGEAYLPLHVGAKVSDKKLEIARDDTGDNISEKNPQYAELTAQYWVWKNYDLSDVDYV